MGRRTFTVEEKTAIATGWADARAAGESQQSYAARWNASPRRVREFVREYAPPPGDHRLSATALEAVHAAIEALLLVSKLLRPPLTSDGDSSVPACPSAAPTSNGVMDTSAATAVDQPHEDIPTTSASERPHTRFKWDL